MKKCLISLLVCVSSLMLVNSGCSKKEDLFTPAGSVTDIDGNVYNAVKIGSQIWMIENLKVTKFNDGNPIPYGTDVTVWSVQTNLSTFAYCWCDDDIANKDTYGALYNWYCVNTNKLCPEGWHVPDDNAWTSLINYLGGDSIAGGKLKESGISHWSSPNTAATNKSGFSALPGGYRNGPTFYDLHLYGGWWTSTEDIGNFAWQRAVYFYYPSVERGKAMKIAGSSVRCLKD